MAHKTYVEIYKAVKFIEENHSKLFPTEIINRIDISYTMLKKVAADLEVQLLTQERVRKRKKKGFFIKLLDRVFHTKKQSKKVA